MSRSIESRKALIRTIDRSASLGARRAEFRQRLRERGSKQRIKWAVREERRIAPGPRHPVDPDTIPIRVFDEGPYVHFPASVEDIRAVMCLLPPGSLDGVALVDCCLGEYDQSEPSGDDPDGPTPDPLVGRYGYEMLNGVYGGDVLAEYWHGDARIRLYAFVYDRARPETRRWEVALRAKQLASLAHEVAHHDDRTRRFARGRWIMQRKALNERYARRLEREWAEHYVLPYVRETYSRTCAPCARGTARTALMSSPTSTIRAAVPSVAYSLRWRHRPDES